MTFLLDDFLIRATLAGLAVALAAAPLGCFVVWRRMAYFGDATAHAAILGVALALAFNLSVFLGVIAISVLMATLVTRLSGRGFAMDTALGVLSHGALAAGPVAVAFLPNARVDLEAYLFGDILAVGVSDILVVWTVAALVTGLLFWHWSALLTATLNPDLAVAGGINPRRMQLILTISLALTVAVAIKIVGALLITALLIIPAAAARPLSRTPEGMAALAALIGVASVFGGLGAAFQADTPAGPSIVVAAACCFAIIAGLGRLRPSG